MVAFFSSLVTTIVFEHQMTIFAERKEKEESREKSRTKALDTAGDLDIHRNRDQRISKYAFMKTTIL